MNRRGMHDEDSRMEVGGERGGGISIDGHGEIGWNSESYSYADIDPKECWKRDIRTMELTRLGCPWRRDQT